jgi:enamine deaminase RidA (YjgF/YER057c/UK114 family)
MTLQRVPERTTPIVALPASVWVEFQVFVFISVGVGLVHMLRGEGITKNPLAREAVGNVAQHFGKALDKVRAQEQW